MLRIVLFAALLQGCSGCTFRFDWVDQLRAERALVRQDYSEAIRLLEKIMKADPDTERALSASRMAAPIAHIQTKNYAKAVEFYKHIVLRSQSAEERKTAQRFIAQIQFENLHEYDHAVLEYERLLNLELTASEQFRYRMNLAKAHFNLNNIGQALTEIDVILKKSKSPDEIFEAKVLKANTEVSAKRLNESVALWQQIIQEFPEKAKKENIALNLTVVLEELGEFEKAIELLVAMREGYPQRDFLDLRIQRLRERRDNQPGAHGLKR